MVEKLEKKMRDGTGAGRKAPDRKATEAVKEKNRAVRAPEQKKETERQLKTGRQGAGQQRMEKQRAARQSEGMQQDAREIALSLLMDIFEDGKFSHLALREALTRNSALPERDRALITRLVEGCLELSVQLDYILNRYSKIRVPKMKPLIRNILRMGAYQLLYLDRIPGSAAINEAVKLTKKRGLAGLGGYVNAVLRSISREKEEILSGLRDAAKTPGFVRFSLPEWLYTYFELNYGKEETERMAGYFLSEKHCNYVRYRDGRTEEIAGNISENPEFLRGELTVQDYASQQVGLWAAPKTGDYVLDLCAAPGGKACHAAELLKGSGMVDARDQSTEKVRMIEENRKRMRLTNLRTKVWDARMPDASLLTADGSGRADIVLCDLPCSGLGILRKKPDIRLGASLQGIRELQALQREILSVACRYVKPGGRLLYSTCTLTREENEQNRDWIRSTLGLSLLREEKLLPGQPSDGFYIAEFRKDEAERKDEEKSERS